METQVTEIAPDVYRLSTYVDDVGIVFNQFLVAADEPLLFHSGPRALFPWCRRPSSASSPCRSYAGSRSATSRRTSAAP
ncbi:hypothetical protein [Geodermatophilus sp. URMC 65]